MTQATKSDDIALTQQNPIRLLSGLLALVLVSALLYMILWWLIRAVVLLTITGTLIGAGLGLGLAIMQIRRGRLQAGVIIAATVTLVANLTWITIVPVLYPVLSLLPVLAVAIVLLYLGSRGLRVVVGLSMASAILLSVLVVTTPLHLALPPQIGTIVVPLVTPPVTAAVLVLLWQFHQRLNHALRQSEEANQALRATGANLEALVAARTADLESALAENKQRADIQQQLLSELETQREAVRELSVPVLPVARGVLVVPLVGALDSQRIQQLQQRALAAIEQRQARTLLLDVTGVPVIDTQVAQGLVAVVQTAHLLGATAVMVGIRPEVAQAIVGLENDLGNLHSYADLESALADEGRRRGSVDHSFAS